MIWYYRIKFWITNFFERRRFKKERRQQDPFIYEEDQ
jgi:hypothetical protein